MHMSNMTCMQTVQEHNELNQRSIKWVAKAKAASTFLQGSEVSAWAEWCRQAERLDLQPPVSAAMKNFVKASRRRQVRVKTTLAVAGVTTVLLIISLASWALVMRSVANQQRQVAEERYRAAELSTARANMLLLLQDANPQTPAQLRAVRESVKVMRMPCHLRCLHGPRIHTGVPGLCLSFSCLPALHPTRPSVNPHSPYKSCLVCSYPLPITCPPQPSRSPLLAGRSLFNLPWTRARFKRHHECPHPQSSQRR